MTILISQRVEILPQRREVRDSLDRAWYPTLDGLFGQQKVVPVPNSLAAARALLDNEPTSTIILTGGNDVYEERREVLERNEVEHSLVQHAVEKRVPLLAVCRGFQHLNVLLGGEIDPVDGHVAVPHEVFSPNESIRFCVNSYHNQAVRQGGLAKDLRVRLQSEGNLIEAAAHKSEPWLGVMWHPERENPDEEPQAEFIRSFFREYKS